MELSHGEKVTEGGVDENVSEEFIAEALSISHFLTGTSVTRFGEISIAKVPTF